LLFAASWYAACITNGAMHGVDRSVPREHRDSGGRDDMEETRFSEGGGKASGFLMGLACGAAVGAALGLLFAPKPGSELRRDIEDRAGKLRKRAERAYDDATEAIGEGVSHLGRFGEDLAARGRKAAQRAGQQARNTVGDVRRGTQGNGSENPIS